MRGQMTKQYKGLSCHREAASAIAIAETAFDARVLGSPMAGGTWLVHGFPTQISQECRLAMRGVYVEAPGGMTEQFLSPTPDSIIDVALDVDQWEPVYERPPDGDAGSRIQLDESDSE